MPQCKMRIKKTMAVFTFKKALAISFVLLIGMKGCHSQEEKKMNFSTIEHLDLERYLGTWYEIARFDHSFERNLVGVTANYSLRPDGKIKVINAGYKDNLNGEFKKAEGKAKQPNPDDPGKLKVSFFWIFYADYFILELDEDYQWALIGSSSDKYLWILSRIPAPEQETLDHILALAAQRGYNTDKLIWVKQRK